MKGQEVITGFVIAIFILLGFFILSNQLNTNVFLNTTLLDYKYIVKTGDTISWLSILGNLTIGGGYGSGGISAYDNGDLFISGDVILNGDILQVNASKINGSIYPEYNGVFDIGNTTNYYRNIYVINLIVQQNITFANLSGLNTSYVCVDSIGQLYRNDSCLGISTTSTTSTSTSTSTTTTTSIQVTYNILVNATNDTYINHYYTTTNFGSNTILMFGRNDSGSGHLRSLIYFNLSSIPITSTNISTTLYVYTTAWESVFVNISTYNLYRTWKEYQATYNNAFTAQAWGAAGADNTTTDRNATYNSITQITGINQWFAWNITAMSEIWIANETNNYGIILNDITQSNAKYIIASSREAANIPYLNITYDVP